MAEIAKEQLSRVYEAIELARKTGKIKKGINEVTKAVERGIAKIAFRASDVNPAEITMHLEPLCREKKIPLIDVPSKEELGAAAGLSVGSVSIAIVTEGDAKDIISELKSKVKA